MGQPPWLDQPSSVLVKTKIDALRTSRASESGFCRFRAYRPAHCHWRHWRSALLAPEAWFGGPNKDACATNCSPQTTLAPGTDLSSTRIWQIPWPSYRAQVFSAWKSLSLLWLGAWEMHITASSTIINLLLTHTNISSREGGSALEQTH